MKNKTDFIFIALGGLILLSAATVAADSAHKLSLIVEAAHGDASLLGRASEGSRTVLAAIVIQAAVGFAVATFPFWARNSRQLR